MKAEYFSSNIEKEAESVYNWLKDNIRLHNAEFRPEESALLILDMQKYFLNEDSHAFVPGSRAVLNRIKLLAEYYKKKGLSVIYTKHINTQADAEMMSRWWKELIKEENPLSEITEMLETDGSLVILKTQYDAFYGTRLQEILNENNIRQLVITGVMTHLCCETTARSAFTRGFEVFFTIDGTASYNIEHHKSSLLNLAHGFAVPVLIKDLII